MMAACQATDTLNSPESLDSKGCDGRLKLLKLENRSDRVDTALQPHQNEPSKTGDACNVGLAESRASGSSDRHRCRTDKSAGSFANGSSNTTDLEAVGRDDATEHSAIKTDAIIADAPTRSLCRAAASEFRCDVCYRVYKSRTYLRQHAAVHAPEKKHECPKCGRRFSFKYEFSVHMRRHEGKLPASSVACDLCGKQFACDYSLRLHTKRHAAAERPHPCDVCGQRLRNRFYLRHHMMLHTGERPYKCDVCGQCFRQLAHLKTHLLHHSGLKPHECRVCGRRFRQTSHLNRHMILHSGTQLHVCQVCGRRFTYLSNMRLHMRQHTGERPFTCSVCGHSVVSSSALRSHEATHSGVRPFVCDQCDRSFVMRWHLRRHREAEHPAEHAADEADVRRRERGPLSQSPTKVLKDRQDGCAHACLQCGQCFGSKGALTKHEACHAPGRLLPREQQAVLEQLTREQWTALVKMASNSRRQPFVRLVDCMRPSRPVSAKSS